MRYQFAFIPAADNAPVEIFLTHYNYQATYDPAMNTGEPRNLILACTSGGTSVFLDAVGTVKLYQQNPTKPGQVPDNHYMEVEPTRFQVGGQQIETKEEQAAAVARGKAVSAVIGPRDLGQRLNALVVVQVPTEMKEKRPQRVYTLGVVEMECEAMGNMDIDSKDEAMAVPLGGANTSRKYKCINPLRGFLAAAGSAPTVGVCSAGRLSTGTRVGPATKLGRPEMRRDPKQHPTVTVTLYYLVEGGVPSAEDIQRAVTELDELYAKRPRKTGQLFDEKFEGTFTTKDAPALKANTAVVGGDVFPVQ